MKVRNSSIEVYRILATFSVLIAHFNGWFLGGIEPFDVNDISPFRIGQLSIASICAGCVNCFLLISGYFGIKLRFQSVSKLLIQLLGIFLPLYVFFSLILDQNITVKMLIYNSLPLTRGGIFCSMLLYAYAYISYIKCLYRKV